MTSAPPASSVKAFANFFQHLPAPIPSRCWACTLDKFCAQPTMGRYTTYGTHAYRERGAVSEKSLEPKVGLSKDFG